eukprot:6298240-Prymnesium_polylepis.1
MGDNGSRLSEPWFGESLLSWIETSRLTCTTYSSMPSQHTQHAMVEAAAVSVERRLAEGYCAVTAAGAERCSSGHMGEWGLSEQEATGYVSAARACVERCRVCDNCRYVSFSPRWRDCS